MKCGGYVNNDSKATEAQTMTCKNAKEAWMWEKMFQFTVLQTNIVKLKIKKRTRAHRQSETDEKPRNFQAGRHSGSSSERVFRVENNRHKASKATESRNQDD